MLFSNLRCQDTSYAKEYMVADKKIVVFVSKYYPSNDSVTFINLHSNETTSLAAAHEFLLENGGTLVQLIHTGERNISFNLNNKPFLFDPNRIYSAEGTKATLQLLSSYTPDAAKKVRQFADTLTKNFIKGKRLVVALHNNTDSNLSVLSYTYGQPQALNGMEVYVNENMDPDDFVLTNKAAIYDTLKRRQINVVLQHLLAENDGSLSVYASKKNIAYINVEAEHEHLSEQVRMLNALYNIIYPHHRMREALLP